MGAREGADQKPTADQRDAMRWAISYAGLGLLVLICSAVTKTIRMPTT